MSSLLFFNLQILRLLVFVAMRDVRKKEVLVILVVRSCYFIVFINVNRILCILRSDVSYYYILIFNRNFFLNLVFFKC